MAGTVIIIEPVGGVAGAGSPGSHVRSEGRLQLSVLSDQDRSRVEALFSKPAKERGNFQYRVTMESADGKKAVDATPEDVPQALIDSIRTTLD